MTEENPTPDPMQDYYRLQRTLMRLTLGATGIIFMLVWWFYSFNMGLNYLVGALVGAIYLKLLAADVEQLGVTNRQKRMGGRGLALFIGLIVLASRWQQLHILPVFLGFLTYKVAIIIYTLKSVLMPSPR
jgi:ATP synthase protein I